MHFFFTDTCVLRDALVYSKERAAIVHVQELLDDKLLGLIKFIDKSETHVHS
jgi:hypothetical protein